MWKKSTYIVSFISVVISCGEEATENNNSVNEDSQKVAPGNSEGSCLSDYHGAPEQLLTMSMLKQYPQFTDISLEEDISVIENMKDYANISFTYPGNRTQIIKAGSNTINVPVDNTIQLANISKIDPYGSQTHAEYFIAAHTSVSKEKVKKAMDQINKQAGDHPKINNKSEKVAEADISEGISQVMGNMNYVSVNGLGDIAFWEETHNVLSVLDSKWQFNLTVNLGDEKDDKQLAIDLAREILSKCKN